MMRTEVMSKMVQQVAAIRADWAGRKKYPGTGFHPGDPAAKLRVEMGHPEADDRVIGVQDRHDTFFFGEDAKRGMEVLTKSVEDLKMQKMSEAPDGARPGDDAAALREGKEIIFDGIQSKGGEEVLQVRNTQLSAFLWALERMGVWSVIVGVDP